MLKMENSFNLCKQTTYDCSWRFIDVIILLVLLILFFINNYFGLGFQLLNFLRFKFFIFVKEPKLFYYLNVYIHTIIFKVVSVFFIFFIVRFRHISFWDSIEEKRKIPNINNVFLPLYLVFCVVLQIIYMQNPLVGDIPFNSVFFGAKVLGNIVIVFSVLVVAPIIEEIIFRGVFFTSFRKYFGQKWAIFIVSFLFTFAHYPQIKEHVERIIFMFILSFMITYVRAKTGSIKVAIILHNLYNFISLFMGFINYLIFRY